MSDNHNPPNEEPSVTMVDILEQEKNLEEESAAVLGGSDEKCCTYYQGYIKRQALYSCLTCSPEARTDVKQSAGICLACSYQCHENHELVELYTKRNFRCDCPTDKIIGKKCSFVTKSMSSSDALSAANASSSSSSYSGIDKNNGKYPENDNNHYNQNFTGLYCICHRPYPDPDDPIQDEMIQCIGCEDWYHTRHLDIDTAEVPLPNEYSEMICGACMMKYSFLQDYIGLSVKKMQKSSEIEESISINENDSDDKLKSELDKSISDIMNIASDDESKLKNDNKECSSSKSENDLSTNQSNEPEAKKIKIDSGNDEEKMCKRPILENGYEKGAIFWPNDWRKSLCECLKCSKLYNDQKVSFLFDPEDTVQFYEENGMKKVRESDYERGIRALSSMGHTQQIDAITEYNRMKEKLKEYLQTFVVSNKVVTEDDINTFFQGMKNEKNNSNVGQQPHFCR